MPASSQRFLSSTMDPVKFNAWMRMFLASCLAVTLVERAFCQEPVRQEKLEPPSKIQEIADHLEGIPAIEFLTYRSEVNSTIPPDRPSKNVVYSNFFARTSDGAMQFKRPGEPEGDASAFDYVLGMGASSDHKADGRMLWFPAGDGEGDLTVAVKWKFYRHGARIRSAQGDPENQAHPIRHPLHDVRERLGLFVAAEHDGSLRWLDDLSDRVPDWETASRLHEIDRDGLLFFEMPSPHGPNLGFLVPRGERAGTCTIWVERAGEGALHSTTLLLTGLLGGGEVQFTRWLGTVEEAWYRTDGAVRYLDPPQGGLQEWFCQGLENPGWPGPEIPAPQDD